MVASIEGVHTSIIGIVGGYLLMLLALIQHYYSFRKAKNAVLQPNIDYK
jgi:hypothetical protein